MPVWPGGFAVRAAVTFVARGSAQTATYLRALSFTVRCLVADLPSAVPLIFQSKINNARTTKKHAAAVACVKYKQSRLLGMIRNDEVRFENFAMNGGVDRYSHFARLTDSRSFGGHRSNAPKAPTQSISRTVRPQEKLASELRADPSKKRIATSSEAIKPSIASGNADRSARG